MTSEKIELIKKQRQGRHKKKKSQVPYGLAVIYGAVGVLILLQIFLDKGAYWVLGILIGITLQRSRFCFAASFRDPILVGSTSVLKAVILALMISSVGFYFVQAPLVNGGSYELLQLPGQIYPVGLHTVLGAILFGAAMVVAGGCASGTLMRVGEGFVMQLLVLIGFIGGATLGGWHFEFWDQYLISKAPIIYLPVYLGMEGSLLLQLLVLSLFYWFAHRYDQKNSLMTQ